MLLFSTTSIYTVAPSPHLPSLSLFVRPTGYCTQLYWDHTSSSSLDPQWSPYCTDCLWS